MRCEEVRETLPDSAGEFSPQVNEHLARCPACQAYARDWRLVRAGFQALAQEPVPEASLGFAERLLRQLADPTSQRRFGEEFLERVGRRFVCASSLVTLLLLLGLLLPSSGPLRGPATADLYIAQPETTLLRNDPMLADDFSENPEVAPVIPVTNGSEKGRK